MERSELNEIYRKLDEKAREISELFHCAFGYYNGHYHRNESGDYDMDYFPIPVVTVKDICDIEIDLTQVSITTKLTRDKALSYNYNKLSSYSFEVFGVEKYLDDFYVVGNTIDTMINKIMKSNEENIFFSFYFPYEATSDTIYSFVNFIQKEGFFY